MVGGVDQGTGCGWRESPHEDDVGERAETAPLETPRQSPACRIDGFPINSCGRRPSGRGQPTSCPRRFGRSSRS